MITAAAEVAIPSARVASGVPGLDALVGGGLPLHRTVFVHGDIGTGKTTFGLQFLMEGARRREAGLLVSVDQKPHHLVEDARRFRWDLDGAFDRRLLTVLDASPTFTALRARHGLDARQIAGDLTHQVRHAGASRLVIDGVTSLLPDSAAPAGADDFLRSLILSLEDNLGCTIMLVARSAAGLLTSPGGRAAERLTSGVIELKLGPLGGRVGRSLLVRKMRGGPTPLGDQPFDIVDGRGLVLHGA
jgi:circadian clock protein KaiC